MYKIALVCDWYLPRIGGIEHQLRDLQCQLAVRGHDAQIITATPGPAEEGGGPVVHRLPVSRVPRWHTVWNWRALHLLQRLLIRERFDVVHGHSLYSPLAVASTCLARTLGIPSVLTNHSLLGRVLPTLLFPLVAVAKRRPAADIVTGVSRAVVGDLSKSLGRADVCLIPNAVNLTDWAAHSTRSAASTHPQIVSVMRLTRRKRPLDLIRAIPRICARLPPRLWPRFTIVGDGSERPRAEHEVRRLGLADRVHFLGFRPREELKTILSQASIFVLPTVQEAFGMAVLEARCVGLPVVAMNHGGIGDILESGAGGFLTRTYDEFADRIADLVRDPSLRARLAGTGIATLARFGWDVVTEQYLDVYRRAMVTSHAREQCAPR
jgi:glycosyltransferase involved in cell wall biosynthesis